MHLWLNSTLAGLPKYNDTYARASSTDSVPLTQRSSHTPSRENIGSPCKHDWFLVKARYSKKKEAKLMHRKSEPPTKEPWLIPQQPRLVPPRPQGTLVGMIGAEILQSRSPHLGSQSSQAIAIVLFLMGRGYTYLGMDPHEPPLLCHMQCYL